MAPRSKKIRTELFTIDGVSISVDLRLTDDGKFLALLDENKRFEAASLGELRAMVKPYLEQTRRLEFDPFIKVEFQTVASRFASQRQQIETRQEIEFEFTGGWLSHTTITAHGGTHHRWIAGYVDPDTCVLRPLREHDRSSYETAHSTDRMIPFTPERWQKLCAIAKALADVRRRIAEVLTDNTGAKLEALSLPKMLEGKKGT